MKPDFLFVCGGLFACASALFTIAASQPMGRYRDELDPAILICAALAAGFLVWGVIERARGQKGGS